MCVVFSDGTAHPVFFVHENRGDLLAIHPTKLEEYTMEPLTLLPILALLVASFQLDCCQVRSDGEGLAHECLQILGGYHEREELSKSCPIRFRYRRYHLAVWDIVASGGVLSAEDTAAIITTSPHMIGLQLNRDVAVGDHDGDTIPDLGIAVVDARPHRSGRESASRGSIAWFAGPIVGTLAIEDADRIFLGPTFDDGFGSGLVMGHDWDGDGREDVLVGAAYSAWDQEYPGALWITPFDTE
jgi:hypothetical protein